MVWQMKPLGSSRLGYVNPTQILHPQASYAAPCSSFPSSQPAIPPSPTQHFALPQLSPRSTSTLMPMGMPSTQEHVTAAGSQSSQYPYPSPSQSFGWIPTSNSQPSGGGHYMANLQGHRGGHASTQGRPYNFWQPINWIPSLSITWTTFCMTYLNRLISNIIVYSLQLKNCGV